MTFLRTSGASLESLDVRFEDFDGCSEVIDTIEHYCTKLSSIYFTDCSRIIQTVGEERYVKFLCSFGSQFNYAEVEQLSVEKLAQVVRACPNLLIRSMVTVDGRADEWERVSLLGPMISFLAVHVDACLENKCKDSIAKCTNLESLCIKYRFRIDGFSVDGSELGFLSAVSSSLMEFRHDYFTATQENIVMISSISRNLKCLTLHLTKQMEIGIDFRAITDTNPQLGNVTIYENVDDGCKREKDQVLELLRMLVEAFQKCRTIHFTLINTKERNITKDEIQDICCLLPCRGVKVCIEVDSIFYRQRFLF